ncbi:MAG: hypothetical protein K6D97_00450 [Clostridia bacterium]|nr:hypothetical protein [Clostridia bacterium]
MKLGTVSFEGKIYNLDNIKIDEIKSIMDKMESSKNQLIKNIENEIGKSGNNTYSTLMNTFSEAESAIKSSALVTRAYYSRVSSETINDKVDYEMNAIKTSIREVYPKFKDGTKNYERIKELVSTSMVDYEKNLTELGHFYDIKIDSLILDKVETESCLCYSILSKRYFGDKARIRDNLKNNDRAKFSVKETMIGFIDKFSRKKEEKQSIDPMMMNKLMDSQDIVNDFNSFNDHEYNRIIEDARANEEDITSFKKKVKETDEKIMRINEEKKSKIVDAMEDGGKEVSVVIKRPKTFSRITKFFAIRFNLLGYIQNSVISKLNDRVKRYREEVLAKIDESIGE